MTRPMNIVVLMLCTGLTSALAVPAVPEPELGSRPVSGKEPATEPDTSTVMTGSCGPTGFAKGAKSGTRDAIRKIGGPQLTYPQAVAGLRTYSTERGGFEPPVQV